MRLWAKAPERRRPRRIAKKIAKRHGLLHYKLAVLTDEALHHYPRRLIFDELIDRFILSSHRKPYLVRNVVVAYEFSKVHDRCVVGKTDVGCVHISTVFLQYEAPPRDNPCFFETLIGGGPWNDWSARYRSWDEAKEGHEALVKRVNTSFEEDSVRAVLWRAMRW